MDEFILRAWVGSLLLVLLLAPLGTLVVWRRMAVFGDTLAHAALLGVAFSLMTAGALPMAVSIPGIAILVALFLAAAAHSRRIQTDTLLPLVAQASLALGLVLVSLTPRVRGDLNAYLFGDILSIGWGDVVQIAGVTILGLALIWYYWRRWLMITLAPDIAAVEGVHVRWLTQTFTLLLAMVIAFAMKLCGALLMTALLVMPAVAARFWAKNPEEMALMAIGFGVVAVTGGLFGSLSLNTSTGPMMVVCAAMLVAGSSLRRDAG